MAHSFDMTIWQNVLRELLERKAKSESYPHFRS